MRLVSLQAGKPLQTHYKGKPLMTGINKQIADRPLYLSAVQLEGDGQADLINHGGPDKAVCVYCAEHYPYWRQVLGENTAYGAFGENFTVEGLTENDVCIGDTFEVGDAVVQVSQPRQPCFKLGVKHGRDDMPLLVQQTGFTGYYVRVLREGIVEAGAPIKLVDRHPLHVKVAYANLIKYTDKHNVEGLRRLLQVAELSDAWRESFQGRLDQLEH